MRHTDHNAERAILACALLAPETIPELRDMLTHECFTAPHNADTWRAIIEVAGQRDAPVDTLLVRSALPRFDAYPCTDTYTVYRFGRPCGGIL